MLSQLFWGEQCATVLPIHNRTKREAILLLDWFSRFLYDFGRKYVIKKHKSCSQRSKNCLQLLEISIKKCACGDSWEQFQHNAETRGCFFKNDTSEGSGFLKNRWVRPKINAKAIHWERNLQVAISGHGDCCGYLWSFAFEMMNLFQRDSQQSSGEMHWVVLRAEQKLQVWAPEHWSAHQHFVASFESFICCFQSLQPVFLVQFLKRLPAHTPWLPPLLRLPWDFNFRSISMYQTHLHTHFSHLGHAFERLKHLFWFGLSKVQAINSAGYVFHDKLIIMPSSHLRALPGEIKWKKWLDYLYWLLIKRYYACLVEKTMSLLHLSTCKSAPFSPRTGLSAGSVYI